MERPYIFCHMETSPDGKIMGKYLWLPEAVDEGDSFDAIIHGKNAQYQYEALILGRTTIDDNYTYYAAPDVDEKAAVVPNGDYLADGASLGQYLIAVDSHGKLAWQDNVMDDGDKKAHVVAILTEATPNAYKDFLRRKGISYLLCGKEHVDLALACEKIKTLLHVKTMMLGGGAVLNWSFMQAGLVDELSQVITPAADGSTETQTLFMTKPGVTTDQPIKFKPLSVKIMADGAVWIRWKVGEKSTFDFDNDPDFKEVMDMIKAHKQ